MSNRLWGRPRRRSVLRTRPATPYLVYALLIHAGLSGIRNHLDLSGMQGAEAIMLPASRKEAAELARQSSFVRDIVPEGILREYVAGKESSC